MVETVSCCDPLTIVRPTLVGFPTAPYKSLGTKVALLHNTSTVRNRHTKGLVHLLLPKLRPQCVVRSWVALFGLLAWGGETHPPQMVSQRSCQESAEETGKYKHCFLWLWRGRAQTVRRVECKATHKLVCFVLNWATSLAMSAMNTSVTRAFCFCGVPGKVKVIHTGSGSLRAQ